VTGLLLAIAAAAGVHLLYTSLVLGWRGLGLGPGPGPGPDASGPARRPRPASEWLAQAGLGSVRPAEFAVVVAAVGAGGTLAGMAVFGAVLPALVVGLFAATLPVATHRARRRAIRAKALESWPRLLEELRVLTGAAGRSIPQALFEVGRRAPQELRPAFAAAHREWLLSTDFERTLAVLKAGLADPTCDAACETLLIAHEVGGADLDRRLAALVEDRILDVQGRKDARAKQAGVRFARRFVLVVPAGMALAGMAIGPGRDAYRTPLGQLAVAAGLAMVALCWAWAGQLMKLPEEERVFRE
jgi:tight adherence protein B